MSPNSAFLTVDLLPLGLYLALVGIIACQRLLELKRSRKHEAALKARGGLEMAPNQFLPMRLLHLFWLGGCIAEAYWIREPPPLTIVLSAATLLLLGQLLRFAAMWALAERWTVRIIALPGVPPVRRGIYRYMRHPNYLGVILEIAALPMIFGCWITALAGSAVNALILWIRIQAEEAALAAVSNYEDSFRPTRRFFPSSRS